MNKAEIEKKTRINRLMNEEGAKFIRFKGAPYMNIPGITKGTVPFNVDDFARFVEPLISGMTDNKIRDYAKTITTIAEDWSHTGHYIAFADKVWDMETLDWAPDQFEYVYSTDIAIQPVGSKGYNDAKQFFLQLADGNKELAKDYPQAVAPMFMSNRPGGIIWFIGDGANGKSAYIKAINLGFSRYTVSLSTSAMEDGRDAPSVIGKLANIVNEASESRIEDTHVYKAIGTHESFTVHEFHKQGGLEIKADFHTVFNANNIPLFSDKTKGARRRTLPVPFPAHFQDNPTFERDTFTPEFLGGMFALILESAQAIRDNGNQYAWSAATLALKDSYDSEVNSVEAYLTHLKDIGVCGFINYTRLKMEYEIWCSNSGLVPLMMSNLRRTMSTDGGACRRSYRDSNNNVRNAYYFSTAPEGDNLVWLDNGYGMPKAKQRILPSTAKLSEEW